eukprot:g4767.t1
MPRKRSRSKAEEGVGGAESKRMRKEEDAVSGAGEVEAAAEDNGSGSGSDTDESDASDEYEYEDEPLEPKVLPSRSTRGRRFNKLVGEAMEKDKSFWEHGTWKEEDEADEDYEFVEEKDEVDSDFDDSEDSDEDVPVEPVRGRKKKAASGRRGYVDPAQRAAARKRAAASRSKKVANRKPNRAPVPARQRTFRASTQSRVAESAAERKAASDKQRKIAAARRARQGPPVKVERLTQEELLRQAAHTEIVNRRSLELMLRMEDDKKKQTGPSAPYMGPLIRFRSRIGEPNIITFEQFDEVPKVINAVAPPPPEPEVCVITGMRARYRDPKTGKPYANLAAFKQLRAQFG